MRLGTRAGILAPGARYGHAGGHFGARHVFGHAGGHFGARRAFGHAGGHFGVKNVAEYLLFFSCFFPVKFPESAELP